MIVPVSTASAAGPCDLSSDLSPEIVDGGVDGMMQPPAPAPAAAQSGAAPPDRSATNYGMYGMAGLNWHTNELGCQDVAAVLGNTWANTIFSWAKAVDRITITTYQAAATEGPLQSIKDVVDDIVGNLADAMYWPYLRPIVILGAIWLAWYGLIRKRATTTTEGVIWMVVAVTAAIWFFSRPGDFTGLGTAVTEKTGQVVNSALAGLPGSSGTSCLPAKGTAGPDAKPLAHDQVNASTVDKNADALWSTLVCKPWLMGVFGTADPRSKYVKEYGAPLLDIQAIDRAEQAAKEQPGSIAHQKRYEAVADKMKGEPAYFLFQGKDWTGRLSIAIGAMIAAMVAGLLIFLVAVSLLVLKVGFLMLLILGPIFLLIGVHPGSGRIIAMRWLEMLIGTLLRQAVLMVVLGVLIYGYSLIMTTALPWGMQIMFMALLTIAMFFYRRPFQHLFASMDGRTFTTRMLGDATTAPTLSRAAVALPPVAGYRAAKWGVRKAEPIVQTAAMATNLAGAAAALGRSRGRAGADDGAAAPAGAQVSARAQAAAQAGGEGEASGARRRATSRGAAPARTGAAPPLNLSGRATPRSSVPAPRPGRAPASGGRAPASPAPAASSGGGGGGSASGGGSAGGSGGGGWAGSGTGSGGGWFGGRGRSGGATASTGRRASGGGSSGSGGSGGSGGGARRSGGSSGSGGSGRSGGNGRSGGGDSGGGWFSGGSRNGGGRARASEGGSSRGSEAPPLWLSSGGSRRDDGDPAPFWVRPVKKDK
ncbi:hypothetical protein D5H75_11355 [Bailinhaonella thermotolerans]|uniref:TrbL/VirB6 plasmid conjugal transfer protein n=2 Tax=Bailinhaonella thermotolerans TaxID=1070861 RepID=A0A3A4B6H9_9ACTN|nr:hypothetical protein D5H75_11355 [Bailinhaonella thermotolerans]